MKNMIPANFGYSMHGSKMGSKDMAMKGMGMEKGHILSRQGESHAMMMPSEYPPNNPLTRSGEKVMSGMMEEYGSKKGKKVFYATMNKKNMKKWHK